MLRFGHKGSASQDSVSRPTPIACMLLVLLVWAISLLIRNRPDGALAAEAVDRNTDASSIGPRGATHGLDHSRIEGFGKCVDCHKSEYLAWKKSGHATTTFDEIRTVPDARKYAAALGIDDNDIASGSSVCVACHATTRQDDAGKVHVIGGVSCESCHNASGGTNGWLNAHAAYGPPGTSRAQESPEHRGTRVTACQKAGQLRTADTYQLAKRCFSCHIVGHEKLVNDGGHKTGDSKGFRFYTWSMGEVRHNFHLDQKHNAEAATLWMDPLSRPDGRVGTPVERKRQMVVVGWMADLEVSLRNRAAATVEGEFATAMGDRVLNAKEELQAIVDACDDTELPEIKEAIEAVSSLIDENLDEVDPNSAGLFLAAADKVEAAGKRFVLAHDGSKLAALDEGYGLPEIPAEARGDVFEP